MGRLQRAVRCAASQLGRRAKPPNRRTPQPAQIICLVFSVTYKEILAAWPKRQVPELRNSSQISEPAPALLELCHAPSHDLVLSTPDWVKVSSSGRDNSVPPVQNLPGTDEQDNISTVQAHACLICCLQFG